MSNRQSFEEFEEELEAVNDYLSEKDKLCLRVKKKPMKYKDPMKEKVKKKVSLRLPKEELSL